MTDTEVKAPKPESTPEQKMQRQVSRTLAKALSKLEGKGTPEETKARWSEGKTKFTADARKLVKALTREGISFQVNEEGTTKAKRAARRSKKAEGAASEG